jgi:hypothetical protein
MYVCMYVCMYPGSRKARQAAASTGTMRGEAGLPRRVTPIGGPGTRVSAYRHQGIHWHVRVMWSPAAVMQLLKEHRDVTQGGARSSSS